MKERIEIIHNLESLQGTCYVEVKPGKYTGEHWNEDSVFFSDETFTYFSKTIEKHYKNYSLTGMSEITRDTWMVIVAELENLKLCLLNNSKVEDLKNQIEFLYLDITEEYFLKNPKQNVRKLVEVIADFQSWITEVSKNNEYISILGV